jgi:4'-phosphopantetheinyl transferase
MSELSIHTGEVHLHYADLRNYCIERAETLLSPYEIERAGRYRFEKDSLWFVRGRGLLREVLSRYRRCLPGEIHFQYEKNGKPFLKGEPFAGLHFNMTHSADMVAVAVSRGRRVGIDIEKIRDGIPCSDLADRFFSGAESDTVKTLPEQKKAECFLRIWTKKEALLKATGEGISMICDIPEFLDGHNISRNGILWQIHDLGVLPGYTSSLAIEGEESFVMIGHFHT